MTRSLSFCSSLLVVLAAACGGDSGNSGTCGDGHVTGNEQCDDGNLRSTDGCSASCRLEGICGNGVFDASSETCDDGNTTSGDGCSSTCQSEGTCANSIVEPGETCDDGNTTVGDGCNGFCQTESGFTCTGSPSVCTMGAGCSMPSTVTLTAMGSDMVGTASGDTSNATNALPEDDCDGDIAGGGKDQVWTFTTTDTRDVLITLMPDADFDGGIRMMTACDTNTEIVDQMGDDGCSDYGAEGDYEYLAYVNLPAGTYYVSVDGYTDQSQGAYEFTITASMPTCGDGLLGQLEWCDDGNMMNGDGCSTNCTIDPMWNCDQSEPSVCQMEGCGDGIIQATEECDDDNTADGDGCTSTCMVDPNYTCEGEPSVCVEKGCGNGYIEDAEECDDANLVDNDRCSMTCTLEFTYAEAQEPNNTTPQVLTAGNHIVKGELSANDIDLYQFTLAAPAKVEIETYGTINGNPADYDGVGTDGRLDCLSFDDDPEIAIFPSTADPTDDNMALAIDDDDGDTYCSYLGPNDSDGDATQLAMLPAGTYTIRLQESPFVTGTLPPTRYMLDIKVGSSSGGPVPPAAGDLIINEFLAADGGSTNGGVDSNCDGSLSDSNDEFIELVNVSNKVLDLTGVTYSDALGVKFTFAAQSTGSLTLDPDKAVVIWGGGMPACAGVTNFFVRPSGNTLSLNDAGDTITFKTAGASPVTIVTTTYTTSLAEIGKSANLSPDLTGTAYAKHDTVSGAVGNYSPGKKADGSAF